MTSLHYYDNHLYIEDVDLNNIATTFGTPCYVYSNATLTLNYQAFQQALQQIPHQVCYAVKANSNLHILALLANLGAGFDIVSLGELERVLAAGGAANKIIFSGVGKKSHEIEQAILKGIQCFNVESDAELVRINSIATSLKQTANIALRINPGIDANTHAYISTGLNENKFGIPSDKIIELCEQMHTYPALKLVGLACHIGSQITTLEPFLAATKHLLSIYHNLRNRHQLQFINIGGGLGIRYQNEQPPSIEEYASAMCKLLHDLPVEIIFEPGRALIGNAGILLTQVEYLKHTKQKNFAIVDAGMNDLLRPALYDAWQDILPVNLSNKETHHYDIVGPVCESADFLGKNRQLALSTGDLLAISSAGAYGFSMSSNYNSRTRPAEVLVRGDQAQLIRRRETINELFAPETML